MFFLEIASVFFTALLTGICQPTIDPIQFTDVESSSQMIVFHKVSLYFYQEHNERESSEMNGVSHRGGISLFIYLASLNELFLSAGRALLSAVKNRNLCNDSVRSDQMSTKGETGSSSSSSSRSTSTGPSPSPNPNPNSNCIIYRISGGRFRVI